MLIEKNFSKFVVFREDSLLAALQKINSNQSRIVFAVTEAGQLEGSLTDGDFRRWMMEVDQIDLQVPVSRVINSQCLSASVNDPTDRIARMLSSKVLAVPLLDGQKRVVAVALQRRREVRIDEYLLSDESPSFLIAEIGNNHNGDLDRAFDLIDAAAEAGADCAKFQMRDLASLYRNAGDSNDASSDLGSQYTLDLLSRFQLQDEELFRAFDHCRTRGLVPLCTPWDEVSLKALEAYGLPGYKIASADFTNHGLLDAVAETGKPMICSTGMATEAEIVQGVNHLQGLGAPFVLLHCNSTYPAPFKDVNLRYMQHLQEISSGLVGYSGHERDIHTAVAAVALGAKVIEKHFTLDKTMEGNDHKVSLLPEEFAQMVTGIRQVEEALGSGGQRSVSQGEMMNRENLAKSLVATRDIEAGVEIQPDMIAVRSPGQGLQPNHRQELIGRTLPNAKRAGEFFYPSDLGAGRVEARSYSFARKWGVPVRYHDLRQMLESSNPDLLEIHLSYKDMELDFREYIDAPLDLGLVVHAPELFAGDHTLDLCTDDDEYRNRSIRELQRVIDLTRELAPSFLRTDRPCIVTNVGGFSHRGHLDAAQCERRYERLEESLSQLDMAGVEIIPQTMPPFPWHFGGQQFHNLFVDHESIVRICRKHALRVCLDISHSRLACNHRKVSFARFLREVLPLTAHLHIADASGVDGEGLQIHDGDIDWQEFWDLFEELAPADASFIPEIWQGHKNEGEGAWRALERLEQVATAQARPVRADQGA
jgi:N-acetylneuraminate synthase